MWVDPDIRQQRVASILLGLIRREWGLAGTFLRYQAPVTRDGASFLTAADPAWLDRLVICEGHGLVPVEAEDASEAMLLGSGFQVPDDLSGLTP